MAAVRILLLLLVGSVTANPACGEDGLLRPTFERNRPGAYSNGPRGLPSEKPSIRFDQRVEPATFRSVASAKPLLAGDPWEISASGESHKKPKPVTTTTPVNADKSPPVASESRSSFAIEDKPAVNAPVKERPPAASPSPASPPASDGSAERPHRRLGDSAAPTTKRIAGSESPFSQLASWRPSSDSLTKTGAGLALAVGLLLVTTWLIRKSLPRSARPLPNEVAESLGRFPLSNRQTAQLLKVGHKLVLVAVTPDGAETLTEITDPGEVQRLLAACDHHNGRGSSAEFDQIFQQMAREPAPSSFLGDEPRDAYGVADGSFDPRTLADAYAHTPGGQGRG